MTSKMLLEKDLSEKPAPTESTPKFRKQVSTYLTHYSDAVTSWLKSKDMEIPDKFPDKPEEIEKVTADIIDIIDRNNAINELLNSERYQKIRERERKLKGDCLVSAVACVDERIPRVYFGREVSVWKVPAGEVITERRNRDNLRIPRSPTLKRGIRMAANSDREFLELMFFHDSSCSAMGLIMDNLENHGSLNYREKYRISQRSNNEDANAMLLDQTSVEAILNYYNIQRELAGKPRAASVGFTAGIEVKTKSVIYRNYKDNAIEDELHSGKLTTKHADLIRKLSQKQAGKAKDNYNDPQKLIDLYEVIVDISESIINSDNELKDEVDSYISKNHPQLSEAQRQAARWMIIRQSAFQYLSGLNEAKEEVPHNFAPIDISMRGECLGEFDTEPHFWCASADGQKAIEQTDLQLRVGASAPDYDNSPTISFVCSSANTFDAVEMNKSYGRALENNELLFVDIAKNPTLQDHILNGRLVLIPIIVDDETRMVIEIPNHSGSF